MDERNKNKSEYEAIMLTICLAGHAGRGIADESEITCKADRARTARTKWISFFRLLVFPLVIIHV